MKNIAKCKLCNTTIESFHPTDYVTCSCGEISVDGGQALRCAARDFANFVRVDDEGNEITVNIKEANDELLDIQKPTRIDILDSVERMIKNISEMPPNAMATPLNHYDFTSILLLFSAILKAD